MTAGGLILYRHQAAPGTEMLRRRISIKEFIKQKFLAQKLNIEENRAVIGENCYIYKYDKERGLIYVLVCSQENYNTNYDTFFNSSCKMFEAKFYNVKEHAKYGCLISAQPDFDQPFQAVYKEVDFFAPEFKTNTSYDGKKTKNKQRKKKKKDKKSKSKSDLNKSTDSSRQWDPLHVSSKRSKNQLDDPSLNYSLDVSDSENQQYHQRMKDQFMDTSGESDFSIIDESEEEITPGDSSFLGLGKDSIFAKLRNSLNTFKEGKKIDDDMVAPILQKFRIDLINKNVAEAIASKIVNNLKAKLLEEKKTFFESLETIVKTSLEESLREILTPKNHVDIISEALKAKEEGRPYVIVFIGVNGVGKSTNLAKVAYLLKRSKFSVMLAACDNFRAGAVEQLKTHGTCLEIPVFDRGYKDDPANIAREALLEATAKKTDVLLIDTAGRMQDNEPLMKALARLVHMNKPDLVIFIGEALVGNDGIDQLTKFNNSLKTLSSGLVGTMSTRDSKFTMGREIDGVILSKFDTVDDKVGAALSMTYASGKPILFVGVGQKYPHLKKLNIDHVIKSLLS